MGVKSEKTQSGRYLLDTSICIHLLRSNENVIQKFKERGLSSCSITDLTIFELYYGAEINKDAGRGDKEYKKVEELIDRRDIISVSPYMKEIAREKMRLRKQGVPLEDFVDLAIACTAVQNDMTMVTDNIRHFRRVQGIRLENWVERDR